MNEFSAGIKEENKNKSKKVRSSSIELSVLDSLGLGREGGWGRKERGN